MLSFFQLYPQRISHSTLFDHSIIQAIFGLTGTHSWPIVKEPSLAISKSAVWIFSYPLLCKSSVGGLGELLKMVTDRQARPASSDSCLPVTQASSTMAKAGRHGCLLRVHFWTCEEKRREKKPPQTQIFKRFAQQQQQQQILNCLDRSAPDKLTGRVSPFFPARLLDPFLKEKKRKLSAVSEGVSLNPFCSLRNELTERIEILCVHRVDTKLTDVE